MIDHEQKQVSVQKATIRQSITLLTRSFGRGTDFICIDDTVVTKGGVVVIQTFLSMQISEEAQIKGRTARQSNPGSYYLYVNKLDLFEKPWVLSDENI